MSPKKQADGFFDRIWTLFSSVKMTVIVLALLAATSVIGTLIPQNRPLEFYYMTYGNVLFKLINGFYLFDMYHSWWFRLLILFLAMNITVCTLDRLGSVWRIVTGKPEFNLDRFKRHKGKQEFTSTGAVSDKETSYQTLVSQKFGKNRLDRTADGFVIFSERGRSSRLGVYVVHISVLLLLFGSLLGSLLGFEGSVTIPQGEEVDHVELKNSNFTIPLNFKIRCDRFQLTEYDNGTPKEFKSDLSIIENGKEILKKSIIVNDPLRYKGINIFQASYGTIPGNTLNLTFTSRDSGMVYPKTVKPNEPVELPENLGVFTLVDHIESYPMMGRDIGECFIGKITTKDGNDQDVIMPVQFRTFDKMRKGSVSVTLVDFEKKYYTGLQVTKDPGVYLVYLGFILMIVGCYIAFFTSHQNVCVEVVKVDESSCRTAVYGYANKNRMGMAMVVRKLSNMLKTL